MILEMSVCLILCCILIMIRLYKQFFPMVFLHSFLTRVLSKEILHLANVCFRMHAIAQPCSHTTSKMFKCGKAILYIIYTVKLG